MTSYARNKDLPCSTVKLEASAGTGHLKAAAENATSGGLVEFRIAISIP